MTGLIVYELNEVPWRVLDTYVRQNPNGNLAQHLGASRTFTTVTEDQGELHPWTTWPTAHRGLYNTEHGITFINQEIEDEHAPIWELLMERGVRVGVFGSLQSHAGFPSDPSRYAFYVPDTFATDERTYPKRYEPFQRFNLMMTARDGGATVRGVPVDAQSVRDLMSMVTSGLRPTTALGLAKHLVDERREPLHKTRRSVMQAPVAFDFFMDAMRRERPDFATFFSNHVAGMMHRYWKFAFPGDFEHRNASDGDRFRAKSVEFAMGIADRQLGVLREEAKRRGMALLVMSSMGQEAIERGEYVGELRLVDTDRFASRIGFRGQFEANLAMQPDFAFAFRDDAECDAFVDGVRRLTALNDVPLFSEKRSGPSLNVNLKADNETIRRGEVKLDGEVVAIDSLGIDVVQRDQGTAYHVPEGIFLLDAPGVDPYDGREEIGLAQVCPTILDWFGVAPLDYMLEPASLYSKQRAA